MLDIKNLRALEAAATPGPWGIGYGFNLREDCEPPHYVNGADPAAIGIKLATPWIEGAWDNDAEARANAALIVALRNNATALLDIAETRATEGQVDAGEVERLRKDRDVAVRWANQSVDMLKDAFFPVADALRSLEVYLRDTPHHNAPEAAAARKALARFDAPDIQRCAEGPADGRVKAFANKVEAEARRYAGFYPEASDGRNTFVIFADFVARAALSSTTADSGSSGGEAHSQEKTNG